MIAAPAWRPHFHEAADDALMFRVTDEPVMQRLGFFARRGAGKPAH